MVEWRKHKLGWAFGEPGQYSMLSMSGSTMMERGNFVTIAIAIAGHAATGEAPGQAFGIACAMLPPLI